MNITVTINGQAFPCRQTMGALLRYKEETGKEISDKAGFSELLTLLYCCIVSACKHDGIDFNMSLLDFADSIEPADVTRWITAVSENNEETSDSDKKKRL